MSFKIVVSRCGANVLLKSLTRKKKMLKLILFVLLWFTKCVDTENISCGASCLCSFETEKTQPSGLESIRLSISNCSENSVDWSELVNTTSQHRLLSVQLVDSVFTRLPSWICQLTQVHAVTVSSSQLQHVPHQCFQNITGTLETLDLSGNPIQHLSADLWETISSSKDLKQVLLHNNLLTELPSNFYDLDFSQLKNLTLYGNPFQCNCDSLKLKQWLSANQDKTPSNAQVTCQGKEDKPVSMLELADDEYGCRKSSSWSKDKTMALVLILVLSITLVVSTLVCVVLWYKRKHVYTKLRFHPFDNDECEGEDMTFDIYLSYASDSQEWVEGHLLPYLVAKKFKVYHSNQQLMNTQIASQDPSSFLPKSKRRLCVISNNYATDDDGCAVLIKSLELDRSMHRQRTIILLYDLEASVLGCVPSTMQSQLKTYKILPRNKKKFHHELLYYLPRIKCRQGGPGQFDVVVPEDIPLV